ncbi:MAG: YggS family pyridoxal phosphate-dependent enzyme [Desulfococcaceae bacterium]
MTAAETYKRIRDAVPDHVTVLLACKKRTPEEVAALMEADATDLGHNYVQEAEAMMDGLGGAAFNARWHMIGPLQKNKINKALRLFDMVQTVGSADQARAISERAERIGKTVSVLIEVNSGREPQKSGIMPDYPAALELARAIAERPALTLEGLMTMGPFLDDPEGLREPFRATRELFERLREEEIPGTDLRTLSMGMSDSYEVAIEEGSTMIRLGTIVFGARPK